MFFWVGNKILAFLSDYNIWPFGFICTMFIISAGIIRAYELIQFNEKWKKDRWIQVIKMWSWHLFSVQIVNCYIFSYSFLFLPNSIVCFLEYTVFAIVSHKEMLHGKRNYRTYWIHEKKTLPENLFSLCFRSVLAI